MLNVFNGVFNGLSRDRRKAGELYGRVVAAARQPELYMSMGVPDTAEGRFEMVALMLFLGLERLQGAGAGAEKLQQLAIEQFVTDMDDCFREMGVGDLTVPKKVRRAAAAFYERAGAYRTALNAQSADPALEQALMCYVYEKRPAEKFAGPLAAYVRLARARLRDLSDVAALTGDLVFPAPTSAPRTPS